MYTTLPHIRKALKDQLYLKICCIYHFLFDCEVENTLLKNENKQLWITQSSLLEKFQKRD